MISIELRMVMIYMEKISKRTQVLLKIFEFQKEHGRGIKFDELVDISELDRETVSKCFDGLFDMHIISDKMIEIDGMHSKVIFIVNGSWKFVEKIYKELKEGL